MKWCLPITLDAGAETGAKRPAWTARLTYLVCEEICVPHDGILCRWTLPAGPGDPTSIDAFLIDEAKARVPGDGTDVGLQLVDSTLKGTMESPRLSVTVRSDQAFTAPDLLVEGPRGYGFAKPDVTLSSDGKTAIFDLGVSRSSLAQGVLEGKRLTLTVTDGQRGMQGEVVTRFATPPAGSGTPATLLAMLGLALLGGLILNLMPCVLPVLSIKLLSVVTQGGRAPAAIRVSFLATAAGIVASFLVLAAVILALKAAGMTVGWGIQFQHPLFLSFMALLVTLFACNLFGWFEIAMPRFAGHAASIGPDDDAGLIKPFLTGVFATLLATPCSAPFLGTAVGFALAHGPLDILAIFAALGLGLALPYLLVSGFPKLAARLPKPGAWMIGLRRVLGLALIATALWLVTVLVVQVGLLAATIVAGLLIAVSLLLWIRSRGLRVRLMSTAVVALALATVILPASWSESIGDAGQTIMDQAAVESDWVTFDPTAIAGLVAENKIVFVDITAEWCITCKANKALVLDKGAVADRLMGDDVVLMRGDWTLPEQTITDYMTRYGRYGVPFNAVYGPGTTETILLPELLTSNAVLKALDGAEGGS